MKAAIKRKWVAALRSGKYKQARQVLVEKAPWGEVAGHCCLGVLRHCLTGKNRYYEYFDILAERFIAPLGLTVEQEKELAGMNDDGSTFAEIADHIEKNL